MGSMEWMQNPVRKPSNKNSSKSCFTTSHAWWNALWWNKSKRNCQLWRWFVSSLFFIKYLCSLRIFLRTPHRRALHRGAFCQFPFRWVYYYGSNKSTRKETGKTHLCALVQVWAHYQTLKYGFCKNSLQKNATLNSWTLFSSQTSQTCSNDL